MYNKYNAKPKKMADEHTIDKMVFAENSRIRVISDIF